MQPRDIGPVSGDQVAHSRDGGCCTIDSYDVMGPGSRDDPDP